MSRSPDTLGRMRLPRHRNQHCRHRDRFRPRSSHRNYRRHRRTFHPGRLVLAGSRRRTDRSGSSHTGRNRRCCTPHWGCSDPRSSWSARTDTTSPLADMIATTVVIAAACTLLDALAPAFPLVAATATTVPPSPFLLMLLLLLFRQCAAAERRGEGSHGGTGDAAKGRSSRGRFQALASAGRIAAPPPESSFPSRATGASPQDLAQDGPSELPPAIPHRTKYLNVKLWDC
jgi:hypothetical protein